MKTIKLIFVFFLITFLSNCNNSHDIEKGDIEKVDTIFGGDVYPLDKKISIKLDNGKDSDNLIFRINEPTLVRITISRLSKYKIYPSEIKGADIIKVDTSESYFIITPKDSLIRFKLNQYYNAGQVIVYQKKMDTITNSFKEISIPQNGFKMVGEVEFSVNKVSNNRL